MLCFFNNFSFQICASLFLPQFVFVFFIFIGRPGKESHGCLSYIHAQKLFVPESCYLFRSLTTDNSGMCPQTEHNPGQKKEEEDKIKKINANTTEDGVVCVVCRWWQFLLFNNVATTHEGPGCQDVEDIWWHAGERYFIAEGKAPITLHSHCLADSLQGSDGSVVQRLIEQDVIKALLYSLNKLKKIQIYHSSLCSLTCKF